MRKRLGIEDVAGRTPQELANPGERFEAQSFLLYARAGYNWLRTQETLVLIPANTNDFDRKRTRGGLLWGVGAEFALTHDFALRTEFNQTNLRNGLLVTLALGLTGCATGIMRGYMGRTPQDVMARYGPPDNVYGLPDGGRAYQWLQISQSTSAGSEESRTRWVDRGNGRRERVTKTQITPPTSDVKKCFYTMFAHRSAAGAWIFDRFESPEFGC
jgi:hypothetical protein